VDEYTIELTYKGYEQAKEASKRLKEVVGFDDFLIKSMAI